MSGELLMVSPRSYRELPSLISSSSPYLLSSLERKACDFEGCRAEGKFCDRKIRVSHENMNHRERTGSPRVKRPQEP